MLTQQNPENCDYSLSGSVDFVGLVCLWISKIAQKVFAAVVVSFVYVESHFLMLCMLQCSYTGYCCVGTHYSKLGAVFDLWS